MRPRPAKLVDVNFCCQLSPAYTTAYVWQMRTRETERSTDIHFDLIRLPRPMRVEYPRLPDELIEHWEQKGCFLVMQNEANEVLGFVDGLAQPWQNTLWIFNLVIAPSYRQQGAGSQLLQAAQSWAASQGLGQLTLELQTKNHPAISFAQKHGFQFCGYNEQYYPNGDITLFFSRSV
jgi:ribosomal protein S18 acetylase RimI-like enzyme